MVFVATLLPTEPSMEHWMSCSRQNMANQDNNTRRPSPTTPTTTPMTTTTTTTTAQPSSYPTLDKQSMRKRPPHVVPVVRDLSLYTTPLTEISSAPAAGPFSPLVESPVTPCSALSAPPTPFAPVQRKEPPETPHKEMVGPYTVIRTLGSGTFSHVKLAVDSSSGRKVAIKMLPKNPPPDTSAGPRRPTRKVSASMTNGTNEAAILRSLNHPNIVRLLDTFETPTHTCLVLEYVSAGELFDLVTGDPASLTPSRVRRIFTQLVRAVQYLHQNHICHRDLKIENVLLDETGAVKLADFGLARRFNPSCPSLVDRCGSEEYAAPEVVQAQPYDGRRTDVWALGIILFALLTKELPFSIRPGEKPRAMFHRIARGEYRFPITADAAGQHEHKKDEEHIQPPAENDDDEEEGDMGHVSEEAKDLVRRILTPNPQRRATIDQILAHPWMNQKDATESPRTSL
ncbi:kinase-like domain-containing protein [Gaertneriomyces semiglobifer]|nr:kinase-like domain-containing protein [Gaertneriomyces semiglobifer]